MAFNNIAKFNKALDKAAEKLTKVQWPIFYQKIGLDFLRGVVLKTPVGNPDLWKTKPPSGYVGGRARGNWQVAMGGRTNEDEIKETDADGGKTISAGSSSLAAKIRSSPFSSIHIFNNVPYIVRLEEGWSSQAPSGMVSLTAIEIQSAFPG